MDDRNREKVCRIAEDWGLSTDEIAQLFGQPDAAPQLISIHDSLHRIFENRDQADSWIRKTNREFDERSALEVMLDGGIERVCKHLKYHLFTGY